jgi:hypothetical protein
MLDEIVDCGLLLDYVDDAVEALRDEARRPRISEYINQTDEGVSETHHCTLYPWKKNSLTAGSTRATLLGDS